MPHAQLFLERRAVIHINGSKKDLAGVVGGKLLKQRVHAAAVYAPRGADIEQYGELGAFYLFSARVSLCASSVTATMLPFVSDMVKSF